MTLSESKHAVFILNQPMKTSVALTAEDVQDIVKPILFYELNETQI
jgi:hypothetical protein